MSIFDKMKEKSKGVKPTPTNAQDAIDEVKEELITEQKQSEPIPSPEEALIPTPPPPPPKKMKARTIAPKRKKYAKHELIQKLKDSDSDFAKKLIVRMYGNKKHKNKAYTFANNNRYFNTVSWVLDWLIEEEVI